MIRADLVSCCPIYLVGLEHTLVGAGIVVLASRAAAGDGRPSALADVHLVDAGTLNGQDDLAPVTEIARHAPVLVVNHDGRTERAAYLGAGAAGVVDRVASAVELVAALRSVVAGDRGRPAEHAAPPERTGPSDQTLSDRERQVLEFVARGLTHAQIATRLRISPHTVDTYVKRVRAKLGVGNKAELTRVALTTYFRP